MTDKKQGMKITKGQIFLILTVMGAANGVFLTQKFVKGAEESMNITLAGVGGGFLVGLFLAIVLVKFVIKDDDLAKKEEKK